MPDQQIGAISVGITADLRQLEADLNKAKRDIGTWNPPSKTIKIRVGEPSFTAFDAKINQAIRAAEARKINLAPTISVADASIAHFRNVIQEKMAAHPVEVPVTAQIDEEVFHTSIQTAIGGPYSVPLTWHWVDGPPPGDLGGGSVPVTPTGSGTGPTGTGTPGPTPTPEPRAERFNPSYTGPTPRDQEILRQRAEEDLGKTGTPPKTETIITTPPPKTEAPPKTETTGTMMAKCGQCGAKMPIRDLTAHGAAVHGRGPAGQAPAEPTTAQTAAPPTAPPPAPPVAPIISAAQQPPTEAARRKNFFAEIAGELRQGGIVGRRAFERLLGSGAVLGGDIGDEGFGVIRGKQRSEMAKFLKDQKNVDEALQAFNLVLREFVETQNQEERTGLERGIGGRARSMAGPTPAPAIDLGGVGRDEPGTPVRGQAQAKANLTKKLLDEVAANQLANQRKYATDPKVVAIRAAFASAESAAATAAEATGTPVDPNAAIGAIRGVHVPTLGEAGVTGEEGREMSFVQPGAGEVALPDLGPIKDLIAQDKVADARAQLVTGVGQVFTALPKLAGKFFPSQSKRLRGVGFDEAAIKFPQLEVWSAAVLSLFGDIMARSKPREDIHTREARANASTRRDVRKTAAGEVIPEAESVELGARAPVRGTQTAGQAQIIEMVRAGQDPQEAAREVFAGFGGVPEKFEAYYSALDQVAINAAQTAFQEGGLAPARPRGFSRAGTAKTGAAPRGAAGPATPTINDFLLAQRTGTRQSKNPLFSLKQAGPPTAEASPYVLIEDFESYAARQFQAAEDARREEFAPVTNPTARTTQAEKERLAEIKKKEEADKLRASMKLKKREVGGGVEGMDPTARIMRALPAAAIDFPDMSEADLEQWLEVSERFGQDFPASAQRLISLRERSLANKGKGVLGATESYHSDAESPIDRILAGKSAHPSIIEQRRKDSSGLYGVSLDPETFSPELFATPTGTFADKLGRSAILEHEYGHVVDAVNKRVLSAYAASEQLASPYAKESITEHGAELFAARRSPIAQRKAPDFYEMLGKLSAHERHLMRRQAGGGVEGDMGIWYRGGRSDYQDLWTPGSGRNAPLAEGPMATIGSGLYLTDKPSAEKYAALRAEGHPGSKPVVGAARVGLSADQILNLISDDPQKLNALPKDIALDWLEEIKSIEASKSGKTGWIVDALKLRASEATSTMAQGGGGRAPGKLLHESIHGFNSRFSEFLQGKGYGGLMATEGGERESFNHPSLVVFDPKKHVNPLKRQDGGGIERIRNLEQLKEYIGANPGLFSRWTPSMRADMQPGAHSAALSAFGAGAAPMQEAGISSHPAPMDPGQPWEKLISHKYDLGPAYGQFDYRRREGTPGFKHRNLWLMEGQPIGAGIDNEPLLDPTSIKPRAVVGRKAVDEYFKEMGRRRFAAGGGMGNGEYLVGEKRPEKFIDDRGNEEIIGLHGPEIRGFGRPGKIVPTVPMAEMLQARETGGPTRQSPEEFERLNPSITFTAEQYAEQQRLRALRENPMPGPEAAPLLLGPGEPPAPLYKKPTPTKYTGGFAAEPGSGLEGRKKIRDPFEGEQEAVAQGKLSPSGGVQRVFVVNWPAAMAQAAGKGPAMQSPAEPAAAGPFSLGMNPDEFFKRLGAAFQKATPKQARAKRATAGAGAAGGGEEGEGEEPVQVRRETAVERVRRQMKIADAALEREADLKEISAVRSGAVSLLAQRGVQTAGGEILSTAAGGRQPAIARARQSELLQAGAKQRSTMLNQEANQLAKLTDEYLRMEEAGASPEQLLGKKEEIKGQVAALDEVGESYITTRDKAADAARGITSLGGVLRNFGTNLAGIIGGTFIFSGALGAAQAGLSAVAEAAGPVIERMSGYANVSAKVTSQLADQTNASGGFASATVALANATAHLNDQTAASISPLIAQRASVEAGNKSLGESLELVHTFESVRGQNAGLEAGFDKGLIATTGGAFGTMFGGTPSTQEQFVNELGRNLPSLEEFGRNDKAAAAIEKLGAPTITGQILQQYGVGAGQMVAPFAPPTGAGAAMQVADEFTSKIAKSSTTVGLFQGALAKAGTEGVANFEIDVKKMGETADEAQTRLGDAATSAKAFDDAGIFDAAKLIRDTGLVIRDELGRPIKEAGQARGFLSDINRGFTTPSVGEMIKASEPQMRAQALGIELEAQFQQQQLIPAQQAVEFLAEPPMPFGAGIVPGAGMVGPTGATPFGGPASTAGFGANAPGVDPAATQSFNEYKQVATSALDAVAAKAAQGQAALREMGVPENLLTELTALGKTAQGIELGIADRQAAFSAAQYNRQLFQMNRSLADARALLGQNAGEQGRLGALQRQNFEIGKQQHALQIAAQTLSLELSQRQINFQRAIAGFTAPGITPEERNARVKEAKIEADFAQKQLDIQKKLLGLGKRQFNVDVNIFNESARRQFQDLTMALAELKQGHELELRTKAAQQALAAVRKQEAMITRDIGVAIDKATKRSALQIGQAVEIASKTGAAFAEIITQTGKAWNRFFIQASTAINALQPGGGEGGTGKGTGSARHSASGMLGTFNSPMTMTVGEAGPETVAVLRNVRQHVIQPGGGGGGGGGAMIVVDVHDNKLATKEDEEKFINMIIRAVDKAQGRKLSLMGGRAY